MSRNSAVWYTHTVEELVIWTVEREYGKYELNTTHQAHICTNITCDYCLIKFVTHNYKHNQPQLKSAHNKTTSTVPQIFCVWSSALHTVA